MTLAVTPERPSLGLPLPQSPSENSCEDTPHSKMAQPEISFPTETLDRTITTASLFEKLEHLQRMLQVSRRRSSACAEKPPHSPPSSNQISSTRKSYRGRISSSPPLSAPVPPSAFATPPRHKQRLAAAPPRSAPSMPRAKEGIRRGRTSTSSRRNSITSSERSDRTSHRGSISPERNSMGTCRSALTRANVAKLGDASNRTKTKKSITDSTVSMSTRSHRTAVSTVSSRLYESNYLRVRDARRRLQHEQQEMRGCTFKPQINRTSRRMAEEKCPSECGSSRSSTSSRLYSKDHLIEKERERQRKKEAMELRNCTFTPKINRRTKPRDSNKTC